MDQVHFAGCMEDDSTNMDASPTATEAAAEAEADAEVEEISNRGYHSGPSISDHNHMLPYQQPLESVHLLTAQGEEDDGISSREPFGGSFQLHAGAAPIHSVRLASAMSHLSQNQLREGLQAVQVEPFFAGSDMHGFCCYLNLRLQAPTQVLHLSLILVRHRHVLHCSQASLQGTQLAR